jgi:hypothetical protein
MGEVSYAMIDKKTVDFKPFQIASDSIAHPIGRRR